MAPPRPTAKPGRRALGLTRPRAVRVLLAVDDPAHWGRQIMLGVGQFAREHGGWELIHVGRPGPSLWDSLGSLRRYDAVITSRPRDPRARALNAKGVPIVAAGISGSPEMPTALADDVGVGRLAAEYFVGLGYHHLAYVRDRQPYSDLRREGLWAWLTERQLPEPAEHFHTELNHLAVGRLQRWLRRLPKPAAVFACHDDLAVSVIRACRGVGLSVPGDVSVLGVNNAAFECEMVAPPLSSIDHNLRGVGYAAAEMLASLLRGESPSSEPRIIAPLGIVERASTGIRAIPDREIAKALDYIRDNATFGIGVEDVLEHVKISRATLDRSFKRWLGRTARDEIQRRRIERARELLAQTDLDMIEVGVRSGFNYRQQFHAAFRAATGFTPREFRRQARRL